MISKERKKFYSDLIKTSFSLREVCLKANIVVTTGNYNTLKRIIKEEGIDISHFKRQNGERKEPRPIDYYLTENSLISSFKLKNKLFKEKIKERKCECCGNTEWMGKPIKLELHHINGVNNDNRIENLQILCPNCHTYTDNYGGKNQKMNIKDKNNVLIEKEKINVDFLQSLLKENGNIKEISDKINKTPRTIKKYIEKYNLTVKEKKLNFDLDKMISLMKIHRNYSKVGELLGLSDNAVKKRFIKCGYPNNIKMLLSKIDEQNL